MILFSDNFIYKSYLIFITVSSLIIILSHSLMICILSLLIMTGLVATIKIRLILLMILPRIAILLCPYYWYLMIIVRSYLSCCLLLRVTLFLVTSIIMICARWILVSLLASISITIHYILMSHAFSLSVINILKICPKIMVIIKSLALSLLFHNFYL